MDALNQPYIIGALTGAPQQFERTLRKPDGTVGATLAHYVPDLDAEGNVSGFFVLVSDISDIKKAEAARFVAENIIRSTSEAVMIMDAQGCILSVNPAFVEMTGYPSAEVTGATIAILQANPNDEAAIERLWSDVAASGQWSGELLCRRKNGDTFPGWQIVNAIERVPGEPARFAALLTDMTEQWKNNERLRYLAFHDVLTQLPNRQVLDERLSQLCAIAERDGRSIAVTRKTSRASRAPSSMRSRAPSNSAAASLRSALRSASRFVRVTERPRRSC